MVLGSLSRSACLILYITISCFIHLAPKPLTKHFFQIVLENLFLTKSSMSLSHSGLSWHKSWRQTSSVWWNLKWIKLFLSKWTKHRNKIPSPTTIAIYATFTSKILSSSSLLIIASMLVKLSVPPSYKLTTSMVIMSKKGVFWTARASLREKRFLKHFH